MRKAQAEEIILHEIDHVEFQGVASLIAVVKYRLLFCTLAFAKRSKNKIRKKFFCI